MQYASNTKKLLLITLLLAISGCKTANIPNVRFYAVIPFQDCPELAYVESLTKKTGLLNCEESKKIIPFLIAIDPTGKKQIFGQWSEACRWAQEKKKCNVELESTKKHIQALDDIAGKIFNPIGK